MNDLKIFSSSEFGELGVMLIDGKEYFPAIQCAKILGYKNPRKAVIDHCKEDGVTKRDGVSYTTNQHGVTTQQVTEIKYITEGNLYRLIVSSKLPAAEKFERWVFDEVLPELRRSGKMVTAAAATAGAGTDIDLEKVITATATAVASEIVRQLIAVRTADFGNNAKLPEVSAKRRARKYTYTQPSKIEMLSPNVKEHVDEMIISGKYSCQQVANYIANTTGEIISQMAVNRYKHKFFYCENEQLSIF